MVCFRCSLATPHSLHDSESPQAATGGVNCRISDEEIIALDQALSRLAEVSPRQAKVVEMRYFAGLTEQEVADALGITRRTVTRDWEFARTWLHLQLNPA